MIDIVAKPVARSPRGGRSWLWRMASNGCRSGPAQGAAAPAAPHRRFPHGRAGANAL